MSLQDHFGQIDIYVFDQILRGNLHPGQRILDAGCGAAAILSISCAPARKSSPPTAPRKPWTTSAS